MISGFARPQRSEAESMTSAPREKIIVAGAGSVGGFVGGLLAHADREVTLLARPRIVEAIRAQGVRLTDGEGLDIRVPPSRVEASDDPAVLADAGLVLVTVKSDGTADMGRLIATHAPPDVVVVSLQNGVENPDVLRRALPGRQVLAGMVPFNVMQIEGRVHRGTTGAIVIEAGSPFATSLLAAPSLEVKTDADMPAVLWGKLLVNLNNALNALSGRPLRRQLEDRAWRSLLANQIEEANGLLAAADVRVRSMTALPARLVPQALRLPTPLFRAIARPMFRIDAEARSSMWEDLTKGRPTEIDHLQGAILRLAQRLGRPAPVTARIVSLIREAEAAGVGSPRLDAKTIKVGP
jgi:2-dehydropantoate 2-reductase